MNSIWEMLDSAEPNPCRDKPEKQSKLYPNCDESIWLRSCEQEIIEPLEGKTTGVIPEWLNGQLLRNGPGSLKVGDMTFNHLFDSSALLHRFNVRNGKVTYQCRFLETNSFKKNHVAQRIVVTEFGTRPVPDPCHNIFHRVSTMFKPGEANSDNAMISIYPFNDEYFAFTESPVIFQIDPHSLSTQKRVNLSDKLGIVNHTSHPHILKDGTVFNLGSSVSKSGPNYVIICFPRGERIFDDAHIVATLPARFKFNPSYMHTFGLTQNYFVIVEQPLTVSVSKVFKSHLMNDPLISCMKWFPEKQTYIHVLSRKSGNLLYTFKAESFFYLHIINSYEEENHIVIDICCYRDPSMINMMYIDSIKNMQQNADYAKLFRGRPLRFVLPLINNNIKKSSSVAKLTRSISESSGISMLSSMLFMNYNNKTVNNCSFDEDGYQGLSYKSRPKADDDGIEALLATNLIKLRNTSCRAVRLSDGTIFCHPEILCSYGCETPRINYEKCLGVKYRYFYAISSDVDAENPGTVIKVDTITKTCRTWCEENVYVSEPIFVPVPGGMSEDDGVIVASMVWGKNITNKVGLLILCAKTLKEIGRTEFDTPTAVPKCLHGWFASEK